MITSCTDIMNLFTSHERRGQSWHDFSGDVINDMQDEILDLSEDALENSTDYLAMLFTEKYLPSKLKIHDPDPVEGDVIEKDVSDHPRRATFGESPVYVEAQQIDVRVPYEGSRELLQIQPTTYKRGGVEVASVEHNQIIFHVDFFLDSGDAEEVQQDIEKRMDKIRWFAGRINNDVDEFEPDLEQEARRTIEKRRDVLETKNEVLESIGADTTDSETGFVKPEKTRDIELPSKTETEDAGLPVLPDRVYRDMLELIDDLGVSIERSKQPVRELGEESLRDVFLAGINSHYSGLASGETFNRAGKTDIILPYQNENLFVAECKFWSGPAKYHDTLDQLLEYLTVRDSQAAVMIFSQNKDFQDVKQKIAEETPDHERYETKLTEYSDHDIYQFTQPSNVPVKVAVKAFDVSV
jgi:hypothetical protein